MSVSLLPLPRPARDWALFLDIDGTLIDIAPTPDAVVVPDGLAAAVDRVRAALGGAVAFVSGRPIHEIDRLFQPLIFPAAGQHGAELRQTAEGEVMKLGAEALSEVRDRLEAAVADLGGVMIEDKGLTIAVHYRENPDAEHELQDRLRSLLGGHDDVLRLMPGRCIFEIAPKGANKGTAVTRMMEHAPFRGRVPIFIGDDVTDEDGMEEARRLGGHGLQVLKENGPDAHFAGPQKVRDWLQAFPDAVGAEKLAC